MTDREKWPPLDPGTPVKTTRKKTADGEWTPEALASRKWGVFGRIIMHHDSHGLCYDVRHDDGTQGCYDPDEFAVVPGEETCMETYFVLTSGEDGIRIEQISKRELEERLSTQYYGSDPAILLSLPKMSRGHFIVPDAGDRAKVLIIKGQVVTPKPVKIVTRFEL